MVMERNGICVLPVRFMFSRGMSQESGDGKLRDGTRAL
jgi:hypothetical protein